MPHDLLRPRRQQDGRPGLEPGQRGRHRQVPPRVAQPQAVMGVEQQSHPIPIALDPKKVELISAISV